MTIDELEAIARAATPGEWSQAHRKTTGSYSTEVLCAKGETIATLAWYPRPQGNGVTGTYRPENAAHIAAFSPARVLPMLEVVRAAFAFLDTEDGDELAELTAQLELYAACQRFNGEEP
jgi:hypothetical protein